MVKNRIHASDAPVNIIKLNIVRVRGNIGQGLYEIVTTITEYTRFIQRSRVKVIEQPANVIYLPVGVERVDTISLI